MTIPPVCCCIYLPHSSAELYLLRQFLVYGLVTTFRGGDAKRGGSRWACFGSGSIAESSPSNSLTMISGPLVNLAERGKSLGQNEALSSKILIQHLVLVSPHATHRSNTCRHHPTIHYPGNVHDMDQQGEYDTYVTIDQLSPPTRTFTWVICGLDSRLGKEGQMHPMGFEVEEQCG